MVLGHEACGVVHEVGSKVKKGDRAVLAFSVSCGHCEFCQEGKFILCHRTNLSSLLGFSMGHRLTSIYGYSGLMEIYLDFKLNLLESQSPTSIFHIPTELSDERALFISDIVSTAYHPAELAGRLSQEVAAWVAGPIGLMTCDWALERCNKFS
jgi:threonine dehydrogenase-like Zn-dependent dehydrogenase